MSLSSNLPTRAQPRKSAAEAAAREKSSAEYLRRRLKEAEAALAAKAARRTLLKSGLRKKGLRGEADAGDDGASHGNVGGGRARWAQRSRRAVGGALGEADANSGEAVAVARLREELRACRRKLAVASAEASRLRNEAALSRRVERQKEEKEEEQETARVPSPGEACCACGQRNRGRWVATC